MFITVPLTTWSARKLFSVATAWMAEKMRPTKPPARRESQIVMLQESQQKSS